MEDKHKQLEKLQTVKVAPMLAIFEELQSLNKKMQELVDKPEVEIPEHSCPEMPEVDFTETNNLLRNILAELQKPKEDIEIEMDIV